MLMIMIITIIIINKPNEPMKHSEFLPLRIKISLIIKKHRKQTDTTLMFNKVTEKRNILSTYFLHSFIYLFTSHIPKS